MKRNLTIREVLLELRAQTKAYRNRAFCNESAIQKAQTRHAIEALTFAIAFIRKHRVTAKTLQRLLDERSYAMTSANDERTGDPSEYGDS